MMAVDGQTCRSESYVCTLHAWYMQAVGFAIVSSTLLYPLRTRWGTYLRCCSQEGRSL